MTFAAAAASDLQPIFQCRKNLLAPRFQNNAKVVFFQKNYRSYLDDMTNATDATSKIKTIYTWGTFFPLKIPEM